MAPKLAIAPSILAADFARLGEAIKTVERAGADRLQIDVMDGHFVPNISVGPVVVQSIRPITDLPFDVHLMISEPDRYLEAFAEAGADTLIVHVEACPKLSQTVQGIHELGVKAGVAVSPDTPISAIKDIAPDVEMVLIMSVYPGFSGQSFLEGAIGRLREARALLDQCNPEADLCVDGGIGPENAGHVVEAGANILVAASAIYRSKDKPGPALARLKKIASAAAMQTKKGL